MDEYPLRLILSYKERKPDGTLNTKVHIAGRGDTMDPMTSLLANVAFGLAFIAFVFILYRIGMYHAPRGDAGLSMRHDDTAAANIARVQVETVQRAERTGGVSSCA